MEMASVQPEISRESQWQSKLPKRKFISANTREYEYASYMSAWVSKVERVGNLNYPAELRARKLHGDLVMTVGIRRNGTIESIDVRRSSGIEEIDRAAVRIVRLAAPYSPLPDNIAEGDETFSVTLTNAGVGGAIGTALATGTIGIIVAGIVVFHLVVMDLNVFWAKLMRRLPI